MTREVKSVLANLSVEEGARLLSEWGVHGAPVVDEKGQCIGVVSVSDLSRALSMRQTAQPKTCSFQENAGRSAGGEPVVRCQLSEGVCPFQQVRELSDGRREVTCSEPHCVPTEWQMVEVESHNVALIRDVMSHDIVSVTPDVPISEMARVMLDRGVHRLLVLTFAGGPVGIVSVDDVLRAIAHPNPSHRGGIA
jgi:CBS domain-containing protein